MSNLYELTEDFTTLFDKFDEISAYEPDTDADGEYIDGNGNIIENITQYRQDMLDAWFDTLSALECEFKDKAENIAAMIKQYSEAADMHEREERTQRAAKERCRREAERLKTYLLNAMDAMSIEKISGIKASISIKRNPESVVVDNELAFIEWAASHNRDDLLRYKEPEISKTAVKAAIKAGERIPARLERERKVVIK